MATEPGSRLFSFVQWAERGGYGPQGHGNTVPRFHVTWDTGPALVEPFLAKVLEGVDTGRVGLHFRHRALSLTTTADRSPAFPATFCNRRRRSGDNIRPRRHREL
ncbi:hypothetical protein [Paenarthrobacter sp. TA1.8]|uniref:hypothetical protein n=1 Tax=Paenarthrobacter sp. TA1.8 TaxID=3400219 RepID=UPI003B43A2F5